MDDKRQDIHNSDIPVLCRSCEARHKGVCGALNPNQLIELAKHTTRTEHHGDEEIYAAEDSSAKYANVLSGVVKLSKLMPDGRQQIVGLQFAPDFVGRPFQESNEVFAQAAGEIKLCSFPKNILDKLIEKTPELKQKLLEQALKELDESREIMLTLGRKTAGEKLATFLLIIASHIDPDGLKLNKPIEFEIPLKRAEIADFLGLTIETVSRQLTKLRKSRVIEIEQNRLIKIPNIELLKNVSEGA